MCTSILDYKDWYVTNITRIGHSKWAMQLCFNYEARCLNPQECWNFYDGPVRVFYDVLFLEVAANVPSTIRDAANECASMYPEGGLDLLYYLDDEIGVNTLLNGNKIDNLALLNQPEPGNYCISKNSERPTSYELYDYPPQSITANPSSEFEQASLEPLGNDPISLFFHLSELKDKERDKKALASLRHRDEIASEVFSNKTRNTR